MPHDRHNLRKAAILLASLDDDTAEGLLRSMEPAQAAAVRTMIDALDFVPGEQQAVVDEFLRKGPLMALDQSSGIEIDDSLARRLQMDDDEEPIAEEPIADEQPPVQRFAFLRQADDAELAAQLAHEHPRTIAIVLAHVPAERAADVLSRFDEGLAAEVLAGLVDGRGPAPEVVREIEHALSARFQDRGAGATTAVSGRQAVQAILDAMPPAARKRLVANLRQRAPHEATNLERPRRMLRSLEELDDRSLAATLARAEQEWLVLGLLEAPNPLVQRVLRLLPAWEAAQLRAGIRTLGPTRLSDLDAAHQRLLAIAQNVVDEE